MSPNHSNRAYLYRVPLWDCLLDVLFCHCLVFVRSDLKSMFHVSRVSLWGCFLNGHCVNAIHVYFCYKWFQYFMGGGGQGVLLSPTKELSWCKDGPLSASNHWCLTSCLISSETNLMSLSVRNLLQQYQWRKMINM